MAKNDICTPILEKAGPLKTGREITTGTNMARPALGVAVKEPDYGTCLVRLTDGNRRTAYSRRQSFNSDGSKFFLQSFLDANYWYIYETATGKLIKQLPNSIRGGAIEPNWHPTNPDLLFYMHENGVGMKIYQINVKTDEITTDSDLTTAVRALYPTADVATTKAEGSPSADGRYWCLLARNSSSWQTFGVFTWDREQKRIIGHVNVDPSVAPDHVSTSPSGKFCVASSDNEAYGTRSYRTDFRAKYSDTISTQYLQLLHKSEHSDLAIMKNGHDAYVSVNYQNNGTVFFVDLETGEHTDLFSTYGEPGTGTVNAIHLSGRGFNKPGWVLYSSYGEKGNNHWLFKKIFAFTLEKNSQIRHIAYTRTQVPDYWAEPHANTNKDFTRILFNSTWGSASINDSNANMIGLRPDAIE